MFFVVWFLLCLLVFCFDVGNSAPLITNCPNNTLYNTNSSSGRIFRTNLDSLLSALVSNGSKPNGFYNFTAGSVNPVYGLFLCRGDVQPSKCQDCLTTAKSEVLQACPDVKKVTIWYDNCMLRYSNESIFSRVDSSTIWYFWNSGNITESGALLNKVLGDTFDLIASTAANDVSGKKFAVQQANFTSFQKIYALGQCTPDISILDCDGCLRNVISQLPNCCTNRPGGRVITPSCNIRYETYPFYDTQISPPPPPPSPPNPPPPPSPLVPASNKGNPT